MLQLSVARAESASADKLVKNKLLQYKASIEVMGHLYGLTGHDVTQRRHQLGLSPVVNSGRHHR